MIRYYYGIMNIVVLPNDILKFIINTYGYYKLMYVCNRFKNIVYESLTKCDDCDKNIKFGNDYIWENIIIKKHDILDHFRSDHMHDNKLLDNCHKNNNFMVNNIIKIVKKHDMQNFMLSLYKMSLTSKTCNFIILNNEIQIITKNNDDINNILKINSIVDPNLKCIKGSYDIRLNNFDNINQSQYTNGHISLNYYQNKYTKNTHDLLLVFKANTFKHIRHLTKIENLIY